MTEIPDNLRPALVRLLLSIADDKLILGHRNGDWTGLGPFLEEDIAFSNIAQDEIAHAQELYKLAAGLTSPGDDVVVQANRLAYTRGAAERWHANLVELADDYDWALAIARQFFFDHFDGVRLPRLQQSCFAPLADLAAKMIQEVTFHKDHFDGWMVRLGQGTDESRARVQAAVDVLWPHAGGLFEPVAGQPDLAAAGLYPGDDRAQRAAWFQQVSAVLVEGGLVVPAMIDAPPPAGRSGRHTAALAEVLSDLAEVYACEPDASW